MFTSINEWKVEGRVFYMREMQGEFACSLKLSGVAQRPNLYSSSKLEFACLLTHEAYDEAKRKGIGLNRNVKLSGHLESWEKPTGLKTYFIADKVESIGGYK